MDGSTTPTYISRVYWTDGRTSTLRHCFESERDSFVRGFNQLPDVIRQGRVAKAEDK